MLLKSLKTLAFGVAISSCAAGLALAQKNEATAPQKPQIQTNAKSAETALKDGITALDAKDYGKAVQEFNAAFLSGQPDGGFYLGRMVELGVGMQADMDKARVLYLAAAEKGSAKAINRVGLMHFRGEGVLQDYKTAASMICKAADLGDRDAAYNCAGLYLEGKGVTKDTTKAVSYYEKSANAGHIGALNSLGFLYTNGNDTVKQDFAKAKNYFEKAAAQGNPVGLFEMARMYENGQSVSKDLVKAHVYYNLAAARQLPSAPAALERISAQLSATDLEKAQTEAKNWKPVLQ
ncbi:tetratricopeptide repeat protein [Microvirga sp. W0021]|uniref:Tetratricopeptide repeat protein n=1 Tax=Hohaiivirga grylli TaxID=3133970 RepID=A0ABV0BLZ7_9HYPH